jgi:hypothetical protein
MELQLHNQCILSVFLVACETENIVSFTELALNVFCPINNVIYGKRERMTDIWFVFGILKFVMILGNLYV